MIPRHLPQAWRKPRGVTIPDTQFSFGDEEDAGGDEEVGGGDEEYGGGDEEEILSSGFHGRGPPS